MKTHLAQVGCGRGNRTTEDVKQVTCLFCQSNPQLPIELRRAGGDLHVGQRPQVGSEHGQLQFAARDLQLRNQWLRANRAFGTQLAGAVFKMTSRSGIVQPPTAAW